MKNIRTWWWYIRFVSFHLNLRNCIYRGTLYSVYICEKSAYAIVANSQSRLLCWENASQPSSLLLHNIDHFCEKNSVLILPVTLLHFFIPKSAPTTVNFLHLNNTKKNILSDTSGLKKIKLSTFKNCSSNKKAAIF